MFSSNFGYYSKRTEIALGVCFLTVSLSPQLEVLEAEKLVVQSFLSRPLLIDGYKWDMRAAQLRKPSKAVLTKTGTVQCQEKGFSEGGGGVLRSVVGEEMDTLRDGFLPFGPEEG